MKHKSKSKGAAAKSHFSDKFPKNKEAPSYAMGFTHGSGGDAKIHSTKAGGHHDNGGHDIARHGHAKLSGSLMHELSESGEMSNAYGVNKQPQMSLADRTGGNSGSAKVGPAHVGKKGRGY